MPLSAGYTQAERDVFALQADFVILYCSTLHSAHVTPLRLDNAFPCRTALEILYLPIYLTSVLPATLREVDPHKW